VACGDSLVYHCLSYAMAVLKNSLWPVILVRCPAGGK
jgi:hypothetical protein